MSRDFKANPETGPLVALKYEAAGFRILPILPDSKSPRVGGFAKENPEFSHPAEDFRDDDCIALLCGPCPAGDAREPSAPWWLICLDLDGAFNKGHLIEHVGQLPETLTSKGERHFWFWVPDAPQRAQLKQRPKTATCEGGALDVKWCGGYALERGDWDRPFDAALIAALPQDALDRLIALQSKATDVDAPRRSEVLAALAKVWARSPEHGGKGGRYESALALGGVLAKTDWTEDQIGDFASALFELAEVDDRTEQVLASVANSRAGSPVFGWPKLRENMVGTKQAIGRACNVLSRYAGLDKAAQSLAKTRTGLPKEGDFIIYDPDLHRSKESRLDDLEGIAAKRSNLFQRGGHLVRVQPCSRLPGDGEPLGCAPCNVHMLEESLSAGEEKFWKRVVSEKADFWSEQDPPRDDCVALLTRGDWPRVAPLRSISMCPFLRPDGSICAEPGYDRSTGFFLAPGAVVLPEVVPAQPTFADAQRALQALAIPFAEFPWESPAAALLPVALVLTGLSRAAIPGDVPAFALDASTPGTGKTLALDLAGILLNGRLIPKSTFPQNDEELEKALGAYAIQGADLLTFDNISPGRKFGGEALEKVITCGGRARLRILGKSEAPEFPWSAIVCATGNNLTLTTDMTRRAVVGRLIAPIERPEERTGFAIPDVRQWTRQHRPLLILAGLTLLRAFIVSERPAGPALGGFEQWGSLVADALLWASGHDVRGLRQSAVADAHEQSLTQLFRCMAELTAGGHMTARQLLDAAYGRHDAAALGLREALGDLVTAAREGKPTAGQIGKLLGRHRDQIRDGRRLVTRLVRGQAVWGVNAL